MNFYSTSPREPNSMGPVQYKYQPFSICVRVLPSSGYGRRMEYISSLNMIASKIYNTIQNDLVAAGITVSVPFLLTPQIGNNPARITFSGFATPVTAENISPLTPTATVIHSGTIFNEKTSVKTSYQGNQGLGDKPTATVIARVSTLKTAILAVYPGLDVVYVNYNGVRFGSFPGKKGFFNLP